jgi:unsaturated rhamnogalacturonyl hydrolase
MKRLLLHAMLIGAAVALCGTALAGAPKLSAVEVAAAIHRSASWQLANPSGNDTRSWVIAPLYDGLISAGLATGQASYLTAVIDLGTQSGWMPGTSVYFADDHAVGHAWLDLYLLDRSRTERLLPMRERMSTIVDNPVKEVMVYHQRPATQGRWYTDRWSWCDALYMAPPTLARLYAATGDSKYLEFMDREFKLTVEQLWDPSERLFFRDASFFKQRSTNGKKIFWARGNGWVYAGIAQIVDQLPVNHPSRAYYVKLFRDMTESIVAAQRPDGLWRPSLLDPAEADVGETSGSGFFVYGLAWGVNRGILSRQKYWPAITLGWQGLATRVKPDGYVGYVQPISSGPKFHAAYASAHVDLATLAAMPKSTVDADTRQDYGTGAFLLAGSEVLRALGGATRKKPAEIMAQAQALFDATSKLQRAMARVVPERMADLAWENDKVAFRMYGPPLRAGPEDSGIDAWFKRVPYPVLNKWYALATGKEKLPYHIDRGEGHDGFHTGDTRGVGGIGLWVDGEMVTSDTYTGAAIHWTSPTVAEFSNVFAYPLAIDGKPIYEHRYSRLRLGQRLTEINAFFSTESGQGAKPILDFPYEVAIGLVTQDVANATITFDTAAGSMAVTESVDAKQLGLGVVIDPDRPLRTAILPANKLQPKNAQALLLTKVAADGYVRYRAGFAWSGDGDIMTGAQWLAYLRQEAARRE